LFAALIIQHGLRDHRYRFRNIPNSFVLAEAIGILGNLQFTHLMKKPDPLDPTRRITTRTTTTFSMSPHMAKTLGQHFVNSRLFENAVDPTNRVLKDKSIWIITPKGKFAIQAFGYRAGVSLKDLQPALVKIESFDIVVLERLSDHDDMIAFARPNMTVVFKTMMAYLPMESLMADDAGGIETRHLEEYQYTFFGSQAFEWISEYTTVVTKEEAEMVASEFVLYGWISQVIDKSSRDHHHSSSNSSSMEDSILFKTSRNTMYYITHRGREVLGWNRPRGNPGEATATMESHESILRRQRALAARLKTSSSSGTTIRRAPASSSSSSSSSARKAPAIHDTLSPASSSSTTTTPSISSNESGGGIIDPNSHWAKLRQILEDPLLRMYFRDFLKSHFSEENLNIWVDYYALRKKLLRGQATHKDLLQDGYTIYSTYLAPNAPSEVNIDHALRQEIGQFVSEIVASVSAAADDDDAAAAAAAPNDLSSHQVPFANNAFQPAPPQTIILVHGNASQRLRGMLRLYEKVNQHICRIMAQDSVPKFVKTEKYGDLTMNPPATHPSKSSCDETPASDDELDLSDLKEDLPDSS
ncbi:regulator of G protein signaling domain-containing protein, partial [Dichotomocladium elegans]